MTRVGSSDQAAGGSDDVLRRDHRGAIEMLGGSRERSSRVRAAHDTFQWFADVLRGAPPMPTTKARKR